MSNTDILTANTWVQDLLSLNQLSRLKLIFRSAVFAVGYILSPLTWWNDLFINIPLAYLFAVLLNNLFSLDFTVLFSIGYALTNIAGIMLMKISITGISRESLIRDLFLTVIYSVIAYIVIENIPFL